MVTKYMMFMSVEIQKYRWWLLLCWVCVMQWVIWCGNFGGVRR